MRLLLALTILIPLTSHGQVTIQNGRTLSELIDNLYGGNGIQLKDTGHQAHFGESEDFQRFSRTLQAVLQSRSVVPVPSAVGLVSYRFNEATGTYERKEGSLGPILSERGLTTGKGNLNVSTTYTFADYNQIEGRETVDLTLRHCLFERCVSNIASPFLKDTIDVQMRLRLKSQALAISAVYGMTDRLDAESSCRTSETIFPCSRMPQSGRIRRRHRRHRTRSTSTSRLPIRRELRLRLELATSSLARRCACCSNPESMRR